jgi:hypothetical protein
MNKASAPAPLSPWSHASFIHLVAINLQTFGGAEG